MKLSRTEGIATGKAFRAHSKYLLAYKLLIISSHHVYLWTLTFVTHMVKLSEDKNLIRVSYRLKGKKINQAKPRSNEVPYSKHHGEGHRPLGLPWRCNSKTNKGDEANGILAKGPHDIHGSYLQPRLQSLQQAFIGHCSDSQLPQVTFSLLISHSFSPLLRPHWLPSCSKKPTAPSG